MLIELLGATFIADSHPSYVEGKRAIVSVTIDADAAVATAVDALKGGQHSLSVDITAYEITDEEGGVLSADPSPTGLTAVCTFGLVQPQFRKTGERTIHLNFTDPTDTYDGTAHVVAFQTFGSVWEGDTTPVDPPDTGAPGTGLLGRFWQNLDHIGEPLSEAVGPPYRDPGATAYGPGSGDAVPEPPVQAEVDDFSARWTGQIKFPEAGQYRFGIEADDGFRLYIDGREVMSYWKDNHDDRQVSGWFTFEEDELATIWIEFFAKPQGTVTLKVLWQTPSSPTVWVYPPLSVYYPTDGTDAPPTAAKKPDQQLWYTEDVTRYG